MSILCRIGLHKFNPPRGDGMNRSACMRCGEWWVRGLRKRTPEEMAAEPYPVREPWSTHGGSSAT